MNALTIGKVAKATGLGVETVRFYEKEGLIPSPPRSPSGYRLYPQKTVRRVQFILRAKDLGFTLSEIAELLSLRSTGSECADVRRRSEAKVAQIEAKVEALLKMKRALEGLVNKCTNNTASSDCPILEALDPEAP